MIELRLQARRRNGGRRSSLACAVGLLALAAAALGGCALAPREAGVVITPVPDWTAIAEARATQTVRARAQREGRPRPTPTIEPGFYRITGNFVVDGLSGRIFARGDAGNGARTLVFDSEDASLVDAFLPAGMLAIDVPGRRLYIDDVRTGLTTVGLDSGEDPSFVALPPLERPRRLRSTYDEPFCTREKLAPIAAEVAPLVAGDGRILAVRSQQVFEIDARAEEMTIRQIDLPRRCAGWVEAAAYDAGTGVLYVARTLSQSNQYDPRTRYQAVQLPDGEELRSEPLDFSPRAIDISPDGVAFAMVPQARFGLRPAARLWKGSESLGRTERAMLHSLPTQHAEGESGRYWAHGRWTLFGFPYGSLIPDRVLPIGEIGQSVLVDEGGGRLIYKEAIKTRHVESGRVVSATHHGDRLRILDLESLSNRGLDEALPVRPWSIATVEDGGQRAFWAVAYRPPTDSAETACAYEEHVVRTIDDGKTWQATSDGLPCDGIGPLEAARGPDGVVAFAATQSGLYRYAPDDTQWRAAMAGIDTFAIQEVVASPTFAEDDTVFATGLRRYLHTWSNEPQLEPTAWRSEDGGDSWVPIGRLRTIRPSPSYAVSGRAYALSYTGTDVYRSDDLGRTWALVGQLPEPIDQAVALHVLRHPESGADVLLVLGGADNFHMGYIGDGELWRAQTHFRSTDGGSTWTELAPVEAELNVDVAVAVAVRPEAWYMSRSLLGPVSDANGVPVLFQIDHGTPSDPNLRLQGAQASESLFRSDDLGESWSLVMSRPRPEYGSAAEPLPAGHTLAGEISITDEGGMIELLDADAFARWAEGLHDAPARSGLRPTARAPYEPR